MENNINHGLRGKKITGKMSFCMNGEIVKFAPFTSKNDRRKKMSNWVASINNISQIENEFTILIQLDDAGFE